LNIVEGNNVDDFVKSRKTPFFVILAEAGIQSFQIVTDCLNSGYRIESGTSFTGVMTFYDFINVVTLCLSGRKRQSETVIISINYSLQKEKRDRILLLEKSSFFKKLYIWKPAHCKTQYVVCQEKFSLLKKNYDQG